MVLNCLVKECTVQVIPLYVLHDAAVNPSLMPSLERTAFTASLLRGLGVS